MKKNSEPSVVTFSLGGVKGIACLRCGTVHWTKVLVGSLATRWIDEHQLLAIAETIGNECSICRSRHGSEVRHACE